MLRDCLHYEFSVLKPLLTVLKLDLPKVKVGFGLITLKEREINPLGVRLSGLVAELARAARDGRGEGTGDKPARGAARHRIAPRSRPRWQASPERDGPAPRFTGETGDLDRGMPAQ